MTTATLPRPSARSDLDARLTWFLAVGNNYAWGRSDKSEKRSHREHEPQRPSGNEGHKVRGVSLHARDDGQ